MPVPGYIDATRISPRLYVGRRPTVGRSLRDAGFDALILCALPSEYELVYGASGRDLRARFSGLRVIECPLDDSRNRPDPRSIQTARVVAREVASLVRGGGRALLTCMEGRNRSAFVAALALHDLTGRSGRDCEAKVREEREKILRQPVLFNDWFRALLATVEERPSISPRRRNVPPGAPRSSDSDDSHRGAP